MVASGKWITVGLNDDASILTETRSPAIWSNPRTSNVGSGGHSPVICRFQLKYARFHVNVWYSDYVQEDYVHTLKLNWCC